MMNPQDTQHLSQILMAAQKLMYDPKTFPMLKQGLMRDGPMPQKLAIQAAGLVKLLDGKSNNTMPKQLLVPAGAAIVLEIAQFVQESGFAQISSDDIHAALKLVVELILKEYGVLDAMAQKQGQGGDTPPAAPAPQPQQPTGMINQGA